MSKSVNSIIVRICNAYGKEIKPELIAEYSSALEDLDPSLVGLAVDELIREETWMPTAALIRKTAKRIRVESSDKPAEPDHWRKEKYDCSICKDTAYVTVWTPEAMRWALSQATDRSFVREPPRRLNEAAAKCTCHRGQSRGGSAATYSPGIHVPVFPGCVSSKIDNLLKWANNWKPANYVAAFDEF